MAAMGKVVYIIDHLDGSCVYTETSEGDKYFYKDKVDENIRKKEIEALVKTIDSKDTSILNFHSKKVNSSPMSLNLKDYHPIHYTDLAVFYPFECDYYLSYHYKKDLPWIWRLIPRPFLPQICQFQYKFFI